jgi:hypothetical protein
MRPGSSGAPALAKARYGSFMKSTAEIPFSVAQAVGFNLERSKMLYLSMGID